MFLCMAEFVPNEIGFDHKLPDGVVTRVRMALREGRYEPQWALANRRFEVESDERMVDRFEALVSHTKTKAHRVLVLDDGAMGEFSGLCTLYNIRVKVARDASDADGAAEWGTSPWKLGMLSASLLLWDVMWGVGVPDWTVTRGHVQRAFKLMRILEAIRHAFRGRIELEDIGAPQQMAIEWQGGETLGDERNFPGVTPVQGTTHTKIARRILAKSNKSAYVGEGEFIFRALDSFRLFTAKEKGSMGKVGTAEFREVAKAAPSGLGRFDAEKDAFVFTLPCTDVERDALRSFANTSVDYLRGILKKRQQCQ